jgi:uncharacterized protein YdeI (YjbR/CyaY-like superfamily)
MSAEPKFFRTAAAFGRWLAKNADRDTELVVGFYKVDSGRASLTWPESVDEALCYGWIDGVRRRLDDSSYSIRFTPRKPGSTWSAVNIAKVEKLISEGRMQPAGLAAFAIRSEDRSAIYAYEQADMPALTAAEERLFKRDKTAWQFFAQTPPGYRRVVVHWVVSARQAATRERRLAQLMAACAAGERLR